MKLLWSTQAWDDYGHWLETDPKVVKVIDALIQASLNPVAGLGKPELLKHALKGWWSRRITGEHRLVYRLSGSGDAQMLEIVSCRYHY